MSTIPELFGSVYVSPLSAGAARSETTTENFSDYFAEAMDAAEAEADEPVAQAEEKENTAVLNAALTNSLQEALIQQAMSSGFSDSAYSSLSGSGLGGMENLLLSSATAGETSDTQLALFMLCMLMNSAGEDSEKSMLFGLMSTLLSQVGGESGISAGGAQTGRVAQTVNGWGGNYSGPTPQTPWYGPVKSAQKSGVSPAGAIVPINAWIPTTPAVVNGEGNRNPTALRTVIDQFDVESSTRYTPYRNNATYCNIFVWDVTSALGCEVPHYVDAATGAPRYYPDVSGAVELDANGVHNWLIRHGAEYGWREVSPEEAQAHANQGRPAVSAWHNGGGPGHVQVVCPSEDGAYDAVWGPTVAQAGGTNTGYSYQSSRYSGSALSEVRYFVHT